MNILNMFEDILKRDCGALLETKTQKRFFIKTKQYEPKEENIYMYYIENLDGKETLVSGSLDFPNLIDYFEILFKKDYEIQIFKDSLERDIWVKNNPEHIKKVKEQNKILDKLISQAENLEKGMHDYFEFNPHRLEDAELDEPGTWGCDIDQLIEAIGFRLRAIKGDINKGIKM